MGDLNIDTQKNGGAANNYLFDLCDTFFSANLISSNTCFKSLSGSSEDVFLANRTRSFYNMVITEINNFFFFGRILNEFHQKNYKKFDITNFLRDLDQEMIQGEMYKFNDDMYSKFFDVFRSVLERHAPFKRKMIRGNQGPFIRKPLHKAIVNRSEQRNRYIKSPSKENFSDYKKAKKHM